MTEELRELNLLGATGSSRVVMEGDREWLVIPTVALMEGVIHPVNAATPEFVSASVLEKAATSWNGKPITLGHPTRDGKQCSANDPAIHASHGIGEVRNARYENKKVLCESWIDTARAGKLHPKMLARLRANEREEVSVGAFVFTDDTASEFNGKPYKAAWLETKGDHLAFLPGGRGACSCEMGCGTHRAAAMRVCGDHLELETLGDVPGHEFHGNQYTAGGSARFDGKSADGKFEGSGKVTIVNPHSNADKVTHTDKKGRQYEGASRHLPTATVSIDRSKRGLPAMQFEAHHHSLKALKGASMKDKSLKARILALFDTPEQAASEEAAELINYNTLRAHLDTMGKAWDESSKIVDDLIADETETPTETPAQEEAEEEVETARLESLMSLLGSIAGAASSAMSLCMNLNAEDMTTPSDPRYMAALMRVAAMKMQDCPTCDGTGQVKAGDHQKDCPMCDGKGTLKAAAGARHSSGDMKMVQGVHDHAVALGAECDPKNYKMLSVHIDGKPLSGITPTADGVLELDSKIIAAAITPPTLKAACACQEGESTMTKEQKAELIAALTTDKYSGFKESDVSLLESFHDARLEEFKAAAAANKTAAEAFTKNENDLRAANAKITVIDGKLKAAEASPTTEEWLAKAPPEMKTLLENQKVAEAEKREGLIKELKTAGANTEEELKAMPTTQLETLAKYAKVKAPDFSGRGIPQQRAASGDEDYTPPDSYGPALKALREAQGSKAVN